MKNENLIEYICDACGKHEYANNKESAPMQQYSLPMKYFDETGRQHGLTNQKVDLCSVCARKLESVLSERYSIGYVAYSGVHMKAYESEGTNERPDKN